ncbi:hypothetical protein BS78_01G061800 [Paspalum vaginatum]|nr:hypothetical protein BS78_01G061800 [Paspalum vaginatum]
MASRACMLLPQEYHYVFHYKCRPERGYICAFLKGGGCVISPANQGSQSVMKRLSCSSPAPVSFLCLCPLFC